MAEPSAPTPKPAAPATTPANAGANAGATPVSTAASPAAQPPPPPPPPPKKENIKETIESILVAFILAFVFRAFVVEAFVIPSGSMAPTLMGAHMRMRCQECGYDFQVNYPNPGSSSENLNIRSHTGPQAAFSMHCPNCGFKVQKHAASPEQSAQNTPVHYGDRILVLKYLYLLQRPERWDVVVFKSPDTMRLTASGEKDYSQNYIKRLVGLPGERIMLLDGDVYVGRGQEQWEVQTKPRTAQEALWRVVYDNDFIPVRANNRKWNNPWQPKTGAGWKVDGRVVAFDDAAGAGELHFNAEANPPSPGGTATFPFTDWLPYNETRYGDFTGTHFHTEPYADGYVMRWNVSDLKMRFVHRRTSGDGPLRATMTKLGHAFTAELAGDKVRLLHAAPGGQVRTIGEAPLKGGRAGQTLVELTNVDYRVSLRIDDTEVLATTPEQYRPDVADLLRRHNAREGRRGADVASHDAMRAEFPPPTVSITAERQRCELTHLGIWRDVYYTPHYQRGGRSLDGITHADPNSPIRLGRAGEAAGANGKRVGNEYFVLGDNSILSGDARGWEQAVNLVGTEDLYAQAGAVPERFMLGKAFFVYWPAGYRPFRSAPGVVPNFGQMRFIH